MTAALIVNADDLGMSRGVNDAAFDLMARGRISSGTLMANGPSIHDAVREALRLPQCSFGVHLNVTQFEPLTGGPGARLLVDDTGQMTRANETALLSPARLLAVYRELCAQIERIASFGVPISHFDSHNHVHTRPPFFAILKALQTRYRIRRVRLSKNFYGSGRPLRAGLLKKRTFNLALKSVYRTRTTDAFTEFLTYVDADPASRRSFGVTELMVHPGAPYAAGETAVLEGDWLQRLDRRTVVITYAQLA